MISKLGLIGQGTYGVVYKAQNTQNKEIIAVKRIKISTNEEGLPSTAIREIALLKELNHCNIIKLYDVLHSQHCLTLIFEYCDWDLHRYMELENFRLSRSEIVLFIQQLLLGLECLYANHIIHRDVKPQNLLVNRRKELKLADFGLARSTFIPVDTLSTEVITQWYRPPEILLGIHDYGYPIDIWSAGCVLAEMIVGRPLFPCQNNDAMLVAICQVFGAESIVRAFPQFANMAIFADQAMHEEPVGLQSVLGDCDAELLVLAQGLLEVDPARRLSATAALQLPVFKAASPSS
jgi:cyclin-dependent kinase